MIKISGNIDKSDTHKESSCDTLFLIQEFLQTWIKIEISPPNSLQVTNPSIFPPIFINLSDPPKSTISFYIYIYIYIYILKHTYKHAYTHNFC